MKTTNSWTSFGGTLSVHEHDSAACRCPMTFAVYAPPGETARTPSSGTSPASPATGPT